MNLFDTIIHGGTMVTAKSASRADIGICEGKITALALELEPQANEIIDASGLHIFPGVIDAHVHFNEPGRVHWEGIATGSAAVAAGGGVMFFDMPLNSSPPTLDAASFHAKLAAAGASSRVDFALWGGLTPTNLDRLDELADCGVIGFKAFMSNSGMDDFARADTRILREGMKRAAGRGLLVGLHAESEAMTSQLAEAARRQRRTGIRDYLASRPIAAELKAIAEALDLAGETGCAVHIVHVSCAAGVRLVTEANRRGVNASCETCPHYLVLTDEDVERIGPLAKCAPPVRSAAEQEALWRSLLMGEIITIGSDHSPSPPEMKNSPDFFKVWGGISGAQHLLSLLLTGGHHARRVDLPLLARCTSFQVASRFGLPPAKGRIEIGCDADLALIDIAARFDVTNNSLFYRHQHTPYAGRQLAGVIRRTLLRGKTIFANGKCFGPPQGHFVPRHQLPANVSPINRSSC